MSLLTRNVSTARKYFGLILIKYSNFLIKVIEISQGQSPVSSGAAVVAEACRRAQGRKETRRNEWGWWSLSAKPWSELNCSSRWLTMCFCTLEKVSFTTGIKINCFIMGKTRVTKGKIHLSEIRFVSKNDKICIKKMEILKRSLT